MANGEETLLGVMRGMAEEDAAEVEGRVNASTRIAIWLKGAVVEVGLDAASVDMLCMVLDLDCDKAVSTSQLQHGDRDSSPLHSTSRGNHSSCSRTQTAGPRYPASQACCRASPTRSSARPLSSSTSGSRSSRAPCRGSLRLTAAQLMLAHKKVS